MGFGTDMGLVLNSLNAQKTAQSAATQELLINLIGQTPALMDDPTVAAQVRSAFRGNNAVATLLGSLKSARLRQEEENLALKIQSAQAAQDLETRTSLEQQAAAAGAPAAGAIAKMIDQAPMEDVLATVGTLTESERVKAKAEAEKDMARKMSMDMEMAAFRGEDFGSKMALAGARGSASGGALGAAIAGPLKGIGDAMRIGGTVTEQPGLGPGAGKGVEAQIDIMNSQLAANDSLIVQLDFLQRELGDDAPPIDVLYQQINMSEQSFESLYGDDWENAKQGGLTAGVQPEIAKGILGTPENAALRRAYSEKLFSQFGSIAAGRIRSEVNEAGVAVGNAVTSYVGIDPLTLEPTVVNPDGLGESKPHMSVVFEDFPPGVQQLMVEAQTYPALLQGYSELLAMSGGDYRLAEEWMLELRRAVEGLGGTIEQQGGAQ